MLNLDELLRGFNKPPTQVNPSNPAAADALYRLLHPLYPGMIEEGNINLSNRPIVANPSGGSSTVYSMGVNVDGKEYLIPRVSEEGKILSEPEAIEYFKKNKKHLGVFNSPESSTNYAKYLHEQQAQQYKDKLK